jgi:hypothetical protein
MYAWEYKEFIELENWIEFKHMINKSLDNVGFTLTKQVPHHLSQTSSSLCSGYFWGQDLTNN